MKFALSEKINGLFWCDVIDLFDSNVVGRVGGNSEKIVLIVKYVVKISHK